MTTGEDTQLHLAIRRQIHSNAHWDGYYLTNNKFLVKMQTNQELKYCIPMFMATDMNGKTAMCIRTIQCRCLETRMPWHTVDVYVSIYETNLKDNCVIPTPTEMKYLGVTNSIKTGWCLESRDKWVINAQCSVLTFPGMIWANVCSPQVGYQSNKSAELPIWQTNGFLGLLTVVWV